MSDKRWDIHNFSENDIVKKIELLLSKATETVHNVEYTRMMVSFVLLLLVGLIMLHVIK